MRDVDRFPRRVVGRQAIERSMRGLILRLHRFGRHRAATRTDVRWAACAIDALTACLAAEPAPPGRGVPRSVWEAGEDEDER